MSTTAHPAPVTTPTRESVPLHPVNRVGVVIAVVVAVAVTAIALALPNVTGDAGTMTHYMGLLAANQPWNLLLFMAIPVILAETLAVSELAVLFRQGDVPRWVHLLNRWAGLLIGPWFLGITVYLTKNAVLPLTSGGAWHGPADLIAVGAYPPAEDPRGRATAAGAADDRHRPPDAVGPRPARRLRRHPGVRPPQAPRPPSPNHRCRPRSVARRCGAASGCREVPDSPARQLTCPGDDDSITARSPVTVVPALVDVDESRASWGGRSSDVDSQPALTQLRRQALPGIHTAG
jgi:hypothetical protein